MKSSPAQLAAFTQAARSRSFSQAARALGVTQSAITQNIAALEKRMGQQLFIRRRRGLELTRAAEELFEITDRMITLAHLAEERIDAHANFDTGALQVIANSPRPALPLIARLNARYPKIEVSFTLVSWTEAIQRLADHDVDAAIISSAPDDANLVKYDLNKSRFVAHMRTDDPLATQRTVSLQDISARGLILPEDGSLTQKKVKEYAARMLINVGPTLCTTTFPVVQEAVLHGSGIGILLEDSMFPHPSICQKPIEGFATAITCSLVAVSEKRRLGLVDRLFEEAVDEHDQRRCRQT